MMLEGQGVSSGTVLGKVKIVTTIKDVDKVEEKDIVVTNDNSPLFSLAFLKAIGIISEKGGMLCHLAIVARELKKPCILGVENATKVLKEGMLVEIDGTKGNIYVRE